MSSWLWGFALIAAVALSIAAIVLAVGASSSGSGGRRRRRHHHSGGAGGGGDTGFVPIADPSARLLVAATASNGSQTLAGNTSALVQMPSILNNRFLWGVNTGGSQFTAPDDGYYAVSYTATVTLESLTGNPGNVSATILAGGVPLAAGRSQVGNLFASAAVGQTFTLSGTTAAELDKGDVLSIQLTSTLASGSNAATWLIYPASITAALIGA